MRKIKRLTAIIILLTTFGAAQALAGEMGCPGDDGPTETPGISGPMDTPQANGDMSGPGIAGDMNFPVFDGWMGTGLYAIASLLG